MRPYDMLTRRLRISYLGKPSTTPQGRAVAGQNHPGPVLMGGAACWQAIHQLRVRALEAIGDPFPLGELLQRLQKEFGDLQVPFTTGPLEDSRNLAFQTSRSIHNSLYKIEVHMHLIVLRPVLPGKFDDKSVIQKSAGRCLAALRIGACSFWPDEAED